MQPTPRTSAAGSACALLTQLRVPAATMEDSARSRAQPIRESVPLMPLGRTGHLPVTVDNAARGGLVAAAEGGSTASAFGMYQS